jgi:hypothetical protein
VPDPAVWVVCGLQPAPPGYAGNRTSVARPRVIRGPVPATNEFKPLTLTWPSLHLPFGMLRPLIREFGLNVDHAAQLVDDLGVSEGRDVARVLTA